MKIPSFYKNVAGKAISLKDGVNKDRVVSALRDEVHGFAYGVVVKQLLIFSSVFFVIGFLFGCFVTYLLK